MSTNPDAIERAPEQGMALELPRLFAMAIDKGPEGVAVLKELVALKIQMEAHEARRAFSEAMAAFKAQCPPVERRSENSQFKVTRNGIPQNRTYADLEDIAATVTPHLGANGLSFRWTGLEVKGDLMTLACVVTHVSGHSESSSATGTMKSSAGCSELQKTGAAMAYLQRFSLIMALGLTTCDPDPDGNADNAGPRVTPEQVDELEALVDRCPAGTRARFLKWTAEEFGAQTMDSIPEARFEDAKTKLARKVTQ